MALKKIHVYDMDGTIVCSMHRYRTNEHGKIDLQYWLDNEHKAYNDSLLPLAEQYQADLKNPEIYVVIATARVLNEPDKAFIRDILGEPDHIVSRNGRGDTRRGADMKIMGLRFLRTLKQFAHLPAHFWEDNKEYLYTVANELDMTPHFVPSNQGH